MVVDQSLSPIKLHHRIKEEWFSNPKFFNKMEAKHVLFSFYSKLFTFIFLNSLRGWKKKKNARWYRTSSTLLSWSHCHWIGVFVQRGYEQIQQGLGVCLMKAVLKKKGNWNKNAPSKAQVLLHFLHHHTADGNDELIMLFWPLHKQVAWP